MTPGRRLCREYYQHHVAEPAESCDAIYYSERDFWDHLAAAAQRAIGAIDEPQQERTRHDRLQDDV